MDPCDDLARELLVYAIRLIGKFVVSALDGSNLVRKCNAVKVTYCVRGERLVISFDLLHE